jgi:hypothetical protein
VLHFRDAAEMLHREMENPGALSDVSKEPQIVRVGFILHCDSGSLLVVTFLGRKQWIVHGEQSAVDSEQWIVGSG